PARLDVCANRASRAVRVAGLERLDDAPVLGDEVLVTLETAAAYDLHHQVHGQLPVEARELRVAGEIDLILVECRVRRVPFRVRDRVRSRIEEGTERCERS